MKRNFNDQLEWLTNPQQVRRRVIPIKAQYAECLSYYSPHYESRRFIQKHRAQILSQKLTIWNSQKISASWRYARLPTYHCQQLLRLTDDSVNDLIERFERKPKHRAGWLAPLLHRTLYETMDELKCSSNQLQTTWLDKEGHNGWAA